MLAPSILYVTAHSTSQHYIRCDFASYWWLLGSCSIINNNSISKAPTYLAQTIQRRWYGAAGHWTCSCSNHLSSPGSIQPGCHFGAQNLSQTWSKPVLSYQMPIIILIFFMVFKRGRKPLVPEENPRCQVGIINPTHMPDGSGQQLRVATIVPRPSTLTTGPTWQPVSWVGQASQFSILLRRSPIQVLNRARRCLTLK